MGGRATKGQRAEATGSARGPPPSAALPSFVVASTTLPPPTFGPRTGDGEDDEETWPGLSLRLRLDGAPTSYGHAVRLVGRPEWGGAWDSSKGWPLHYHHGNGGGWQTRIPLDLIHAYHSASESGSPPLEFKFALVNGPGDVWEGGPNRVLSADAVSAIEKAEASGECTLMKLAWEEPDRVLLTTVRPTPRGRTAVVVLGKKLLPDGQPTPDLVSRMKKAAAIYRVERLQRTTRTRNAATTDDDDGEAKSEGKGKGNAENDEYGDSDDVVVIVTGGATVTDKNTESVVMKRLLVELGVPAEHVVEEPMAMTTVDNVVYVYEIVESLGIERIMVVTAAYHLDRARALFLYMRHLGPPYHLLMSFEGHAAPLPPAALAREHDVESRVLRNLGAHLAAYVPSLASSFTPLPHREQQP